MTQVLRKTSCSLFELGPKWSLYRYSLTQIPLGDNVDKVMNTKRLVHFKLVSCEKLAVLKPPQHRNMSILTDLLRRKKRAHDDYDDDAVPNAKVLPLFDDTPKELTEEEIESKKNISRLYKHHQRLVNGEHPYTEPTFWTHHTVRYKQRMFGKYGESSGVNPGILWLTKKELKEKIEYEKICHPFTIQEMVASKLAIREAEKAAMDKRSKEVEANMAMLDKFKEDLQRRKDEKTKESDAAKARRDKLVEEVRRHFGYTVDPREERFQELLAKKEKEQKKQMKDARKLEKQKRMLEKLEGKSSSKKSTETAGDKPTNKENEDDD